MNPARPHLLPGYQKAMGQRSPDGWSENIWSLAG